MFKAHLILVLCCSLVGFSSANKKYIDGTEYTIRNMGTKYTQRISDHGGKFCREKKRR
jgi:hypothetical protein